MSKLSQELDTLRRDIQSHSDQIGRLASALDAEREFRAKGEDLITKTLLEINGTLSKLNEVIAPHGLERQRSSGILIGDDLEVFRYYSALAQQRIMLQNKCVEMSIQVTSGLTAAVAAAIIAWISKGSQPTASAMLRGIDGLAIVIIFACYVFIQLMLLTNYLYHTVSHLGHDYIYQKVLDGSSSEFAPDDLPTWCRDVCGRWVSNFQPIVLYLSTSFGLSVFVAQISSNLTFSWPWWFLFFLELVWLICLVFLHCRAKHISSYFAKHLVRPRRLPSTIPPNS